MSVDPLLQPFQLRGLTLRNRLMSTAHEPAYTDDGMPKARYRLYHAEKARGGIALTMIGGSSVVAPDSPQAFGNILLYKDECVRWLKELADDVHDKGAAVMIQITHLGRRTSWSKDDWLPVIAPSHVREPAHRAFPKAMEDWDIARVIAAYADAAERVKAGGLDGVEFECYGHLIDQFWSPATNKRADEYGGSIDNRLRFGMAVFEAVRRRVGPDFLIGARLVCDEDWDRGLSRDEGMAIARRLTRSGLIDFLNVIKGHIDSDEALSRVIPGMGERSAPHLDFAGEVRAETRLPTFHAARIQDVATARHAIAQRQARHGRHDPRAHGRSRTSRARSPRGAKPRSAPASAWAIASIRSMPARPSASTTRRPGARRRSPISCRVPTVRKGKSLSSARDRAASKRRASRASAGTTSSCSRPRPGPAVRSCSPPRSSAGVKSSAIVDWRVRECERLGVAFRFNVFAGADDVLGLDPDVVIIATGGAPNVEFLDSGGEFAVTSWDLLSGAARPSGEVIVYDDNGAHPGLSAAEYVADSGAKLEIVTPERMLAPDVGGTSYPPYFRAFSRADAKVSLNLRLESIARRGNRVVGVFYDEYGRRRVEKEADMIVVEHGAVPVDDLYFELKAGSVNRGEVDYDALIAGRPQTVRSNPGGGYRLFRIGDAVASRNIHAAVYDAIRLMKDI